MQNPGTFVKVLMDMIRPNLSKKMLLKMPKYFV